jgi:hypothetical protein
MLVASLDLALAFNHVDYPFSLWLLLQRLFAGSHFSCSLWQ